MNSDRVLEADAAKSGRSLLEGVGACVFDAYGTLFDIAAATRRCRSALGEHAEALTALWRSKQLEYSWLRSLRGDYVDSNSSKTAMLGVPNDLVLCHGAVSEEVARAMAEGALAEAGVDVTVAVTGIAGPEGGTPDKSVGLVHIAVARSGAETAHERHIFSGDREAVRLASVAAALRLLARRIA